MNNRYKNIDLELIGDLAGYEEEKYIEIILSEHQELRTLFQRRHLLTDGPVEINGINPILHVLLESVVERQLQEGNPSEVRAAVKRLKMDGFSHHSARANVVGVFIPLFFDCLKNKNHFDEDAYIRRVGVLGQNFDKVGRNDLCPCGSGKKFKKCCSDVKEYFNPRLDAGLLILGSGAYADYGYLLGQHPGDLVVQMENRSHIAEFLENEGDLEGAVMVLNENIEAAQQNGNMDLLQNALQDMQLMCLNHVELADVAETYTKQLMEMAESDDDRCSLWCDWADLMARRGSVNKALDEYNRLLAEYPAWHMGRFRLAGLLDELGDSTKAIQVLQSLLAEKDNLDEELCLEAEDFLSDLLESEEE